jgi:hypothetical protein
MHSLSARRWIDPPWGEPRIRKEPLSLARSVCSNAASRLRYGVASAHRDRRGHTDVPVVTAGINASVSLVMKLT